MIDLLPALALLAEAQLVAELVAAAERRLHHADNTAPESRGKPAAQAEQVERQTSCEGCGAPFTPRAGGQRQRFCSIACRKRAHAATRPPARRQAPPAADAPEGQSDTGRARLARPALDGAGAPSGSQAAAGNGIEPPIRQLCQPPPLPPPGAGQGAQPTIGAHPWES